MTTETTTQYLETLLKQVLELESEGFIKFSNDEDSVSLLKDIKKTCKIDQKIDAGEICLQVNLEEFTIPYSVDPYIVDNYTVKVFIAGKEIKAEVNDVL